MISGRSRRVLVTGGSRGIGKAIADRFAAEGHDVITPGRAELDLSSTSSIETYAATMPQVDVLINNAGENFPAPIAEIDVERWERTARVNVTAPFLLARAAVPHMASAGYGRIVNIGSVYGFVSRPKRTIYSTSKAAINGLTRALAVECGPQGVLVNAVCPGFVDTELTRQNNTPEEIERLRAQVPLGRLAEVAEIASFVYFLGSDANSYVTGETIAIDGGFLCQ